MKYTAKYGHLGSVPVFRTGQTITRGDNIGIMGNTGKSSGAHLHLDIIENTHQYIWRLSEIEPSREHARQRALFIDKELFDTDISISSYYCDPEYKDQFGKLILHPGYDVYPKNKSYTSFDIYWNRSCAGTVIKTGTDIGYGNYILIGFEV